LEALKNLEDILNVPDGSLSRLLGPPRVRARFHPQPPPLN
jgi:hypothetical protein